MKNSLIKMLVFLLMLVLFDQMAGYILQKLFFTQKSGPDFSLSYSLFQCNADLLIFGNSRAQHHYDTRVFKNSVNVSCFNAGMDGGHCVLLPYAQIEVILKRYSPKMIILELNPDSFEYNKKYYEILSILLPYYRSLPQLRPTILLRSTFEKFKLLSGIYPYNSKLINIIRFNTNSHAARRKDFDGYVPLYYNSSKKRFFRSNSKKMPSSAFYESVIDTNLLEALKRIIHLCRDKNIHLILVNSPVFYFSNDHPDLISKSAKQVLAVIQQERIEFFDFSRESLFLGRMDLFADEGHLNAKGAAIFTQLLIKKADLCDELGLKNKGKW